MELRAASEADYSAVKALIALFPDKLVQEYLPRAEEFFVAEDAGEIVGCCALEVYSQRLAEVRSLAVSPAHQGQGIAHQLIEKCMKRAAELGILEVLAITGANSLFEQFGFGAFKSEKYALFKMVKD